MDIGAKEFNYFLRCGRYIFPLVFSIFCSLYLLFRAANNEKGLIIDGFIRLNRNQANVFYLILGSLLLVISLGFVTSSLLNRKSITVNSKSIVIPNLLTGKTEIIFYDDIIDVRDQSIKNQRIATMFTKYKKQHSFSMNALDSENEYKEILSVLIYNIEKNMQAKTNNNFK